MDRLKERAYSMKRYFSGSCERRLVVSLPVEFAKQNSERRSSYKSSLIDDEAEELERTVVRKEQKRSKKVAFSRQEAKQNEVKPERQQRIQSVLARLWESSTQYVILAENLSWTT